MEDICNRLFEDFRRTYDRRGCICQSATEYPGYCKIDLHKLSTNAACDTVRKCYLFCRNKRKPGFIAITGKGIHTADVIAYIKNAVVKMAAQQGWNYHVDPVNMGRVIVTV